MLTYLSGVQPLGTFEAEMALWLTPPGGEAQEGRIEYLAQSLNIAKVLFHYNYNILSFVFLINKINKYNN